MKLGISRRGAFSLAAVVAAGRAFGQSGVVHGDIHEVTMQGMKFVPATIMAKSGDGIRWTNLDLAPHTATATDARWTSPTLKKGETFTLEVTASMAGTYKCHFHPQMAGEIALLR